MLLCLRNFLRLKDESRSVEEIAPQELSSFINEFIITVRKKENNEDYEPNLLRAMMASFERHLRQKNFGYSIMRDVEFEKARTALKLKQRDLKKKGKGDKPKPSQILYSYLFERRYLKLKIFIVI